MPTLPLYAQTLTAGDPESWHRVTAPGGYETWHFAAIASARPNNDIASKPLASSREIASHEPHLFLTASLSWGSTFLPTYLRRYERYRRNPTRNKPPVAKDHCCASFTLYEVESGRLDDAPVCATRFDLCASADQFGVSNAEAGVHVGANRLTVDPQGKLHLSLRGTPWHFTGAGPALLREQTVSANLVFDPVVAGMSREIELVDAQEPVHRWTVSRPLCRVTGEITVFTSGERRTILFDGRGAHDHAWGTRPLSWDFDLGLVGFVLGEQRAVVLRWEFPRHPRTRTAARVVSANGAGTPDVEFNAHPDAWTRAGATGLKLPTRLAFGEALRIEQPFILGTTLAQVSAIYQARAGDQSSIALCELINWRRLRSPIWARLIQLGVAKV